RDRGHDARVPVPRGGTPLRQRVHLSDGDPERPGRRGASRVRLRAGWCPVSAVAVTAEQYDALARRYREQGGPIAAPTLDAFAQLYPDLTVRYQKLRFCALAQGVSLEGLSSRTSDTLSSARGGWVRPTVSDDQGEGDRTEDTALAQKQTAR